MYAGTYASELENGEVVGEDIAEIRVGTQTGSEWSVPRGDFVDATRVHKIRNGSNKRLYISGPGFSGRWVDGNTEATVDTPRHPSDGLWQAELEEPARWVTHSKSTDPAHSDGKAKVESFPIDWAQVDMPFYVVCEEAP